MRPVLSSARTLRRSPERHLSGLLFVCSVSDAALGSGATFDIDREFASYMVKD
jgi:hypothetical protein